MDGNGGRESKRNAEESAGAGDGKNLNMGGCVVMADAWLACARDRLAGYFNLERFERFLFGGGDADGLCVCQRARRQRPRNGLACWMQIARAFGADCG